MWYFLVVNIISCISSWSLIEDFTYLLTEFDKIGKVFLYKFSMKKAFSLGKCPRWVLLGLRDTIFLHDMNAFTKGRKLVFQCIRKCSMQADDILSNSVCRTLTRQSHRDGLSYHCSKSGEFTSSVKEYTWSYSSMTWLKYFDFTWCPIVMMSLEV